MGWASVLCSRGVPTASQCAESVGAVDVGGLACVEAFEAVAGVFGLEQWVVRWTEPGVGVPGAKEVDVRDDRGEQDGRAHVCSSDAAVEASVHARDGGVLGHAEPAFDGTVRNSV